MASLSKAGDSESRPRATLREEKKEKGGYECEFVEPPPKILQSDCSICLLVLRDPYIVSCCGHSFCETCIERIQRDGKPCPLCNKPGFTTVANGGLKRALNEFQVRCPHRALAGCEWVGELGKLDQHFNADPQPERKLEGCPFTSVECIHCKNHMRRHVIAGHQNERCPKRPYICEYCEEYESTFEDVTNHWEQCKCYLMQCPNNCYPSGSGIERQNLEHHMKEECPLTVVECDFHYAGCGVKLPRKDMAVHMKESVTHISLLAAENQRLAKQLLERDEKMQQLMQKNTELSHRIDEQQRGYHELACTTDQQQKAIHEVKKELTQTKDMLKQQQRTHQEKIDQHRKANQELRQEQKNSHRELLEKIISKTDQLQKASQEVRKELTETKHAQRVHRELVDKVTRTTDQQRKANQELKKELTQAKDAQEQAHQDLTEKVTHTTGQQLKANQELKKDLAQRKDVQQQQHRAHLELASKVAVLMKQQQMVEKPTLIPQTVPIDIKMVGFKELKDRNTGWYSTAFYTHMNGYKMCLNVEPNGYGIGEGTHVSVYTCLMCGEFDSNLKWPFRGDITVQLLNQLEDGEHRSWIIHYANASRDRTAMRVAVGEKAMAQGISQFIPHSQLNFSRARVINCQYLKDDCLVFRVISVTM